MTEGKNCVEDVYIWARNKLELSLTGSKIKGTWKGWCVTAVRMLESPLVRLLPIHSELFHVVPVVPSLEPETLCFQNSRTNFPALQKCRNQPGFGWKGSLFDRTHLSHAKSQCSNLLDNRERSAPLMKHGTYLHGVHQWQSTSRGTYSHALITSNDQTPCIVSIPKTQINASATLLMDQPCTE